VPHANEFTRLVPFGGAVGSKPGILGQSITLDGKVFAISGVMSPRFHWPRYFAAHGNPG